MKVASMMDKIREVEVGWFEHLKRRCIDSHEEVQEARYITSTHRRRGWSKQY